jgi:hypothetical protein
LITCSTKAHLLFAAFVRIFSVFRFTPAPLFPLDAVTVTVLYYCTEFSRISCHRLLRHFSFDIFNPQHTISTNDSIVRGDFYLVCTVYSHEELTLNPQDGSGPGDHWLTAAAAADGVGAASAKAAASSITRRASLHGALCASQCATWHALLQ